MGFTNIHKKIIKYDKNLYYMREGLTFILKIKTIKKFI